MIDIKDAVTTARENFDKLYQGGALGEVLLEEAELSEDEKFWLVTFSFDWQPNSGTASLGPGDRRYKVLRIDAQEGRMISMKTTTH